MELLAPADEAHRKTLGERVRELRARRGMTRRILAHDSGVSERYLAKLEAGQANASLLVIRALADAFSVEPADLVAAADPDPVLAGIVGSLRTLTVEQLGAVRQYVAGLAGNDAAALRDKRIALIGLRGAGKSTLGRLLAERRGVPFFELDREVERDAGFNMAAIFEMYGQAGYRRFELGALDRLLTSESAFVLATGGSIVSEALTFERLLATCFTVWLQTSPEEHMQRVVAQGDLRPMAGNREAMDDLRRILAGREPLYRRADAALSTSSRAIGESLDELLRRTHVDG
ncbi:MAG TPA: helix-turn-helix transcriptional regulator [Candidatus Lustribacter sp.]|nr:helix-turn-helix transcriptional regulator [Candidatus Lustribacter sp.]